MPTIHHPTLADVPLTAVLAALADPKRVAIIRRLAGGSLACGDFCCEETSKSALSHHVKVLRQAGVIRQHPDGQQRILSLRRDELDARFPGLLESVLRDEGPV